MTGISSQARALPGGSQSNRCPGWCWVQPRFAPGPSAVDSGWACFGQLCGAPCVPSPGKNTSPAYSTDMVRNKLANKCELKSRKH